MLFHEKIWRRKSRGEMLTHVRFERKRTMCFSRHRGAGAKSFDNNNRNFPFQIATTMRRSIRLALILSPLLVLGLTNGIEWSIYYIIVLAIFALSRVIHGALTFNDCHEASVSLRKEIEEARVGLASKGFKFVQ